MAKIASLLLAIALWFLINQHLERKGGGPLFLSPSDRKEQMEF
jgi:hypothetical protein